MIENKLYPPYIEGNLPAFSNNILQLEYSLNKGVSISEIDGYSLLVKKITTNQTIGSVSKMKEDNSNYIEFDLSELSLIPGQYYKFQLAFFKLAEGNKEIIGYYSTPGIARYINIPEIKVLTFDTEAMRVQGIYTPQESGEYLYSYRFELYSGDSTLLESSGEIIFNSANADEENNAILTYNFNYQPVYGQKYYTRFKITTGNAYQLQVDSEIIQALPSIMPTSLFNLKITNNYDNGYIEVSIEPINDESFSFFENIDEEEAKKKKLATGEFRLGRSSSKDNFKSYEEILSFELINEIPNKILYKDYFIEHGVEYRYAYQQYNKAYKQKTEGAIISRKVWSNCAVANFEDLFLSDGEVQFKVKYNPKISSIKTTLQETKVDTLGGQYPFIFRNGNISYREFPISGLLTYLEDDEENFISLPIGFSPSTDLTDKNIFVERQFKLTLMDWLNNGEVKYFKSPTEGSYLVRLMNVSLTPNDQLGRMLHTFNATAYEVGDIDRTNLEKYNFILPNNFITSENKVGIKEEIMTAGKTYTFNNILGLEFLVNTENSQNININSLYDEKISTGTTININNSSIFIPIYIRNYSLDVQYQTVTISVDKDSKIIYKYKNIGTSEDSQFENILSVNSNEEPSLQIRQLNGIDPYQMNVKAILEQDWPNQTPKVQKEIALFSFLQFYKNPNIDEVDNKAVKAIGWDKENYKIEINGSIIDLNEIQSYQLKDVDYVTSINIKPGVILECGYYLNHINLKEEKK